MALERPFLARHIEATRQAYGIDRRAHETEFSAQKEGHIDFAKKFGSFKLSLEEVVLISHPGAVACVGSLFYLLKQFSVAFKNSKRLG